MPQLQDLSEILSYNPDVVIVGAGNAALCAAISAREKGAKVLICEAAPETEKGGNSHFTGGAFRFVYLVSTIFWIFIRTYHQMS